MRQPTTASTTLADIVQIVACILQQNGASRGGPEQVPPIILTGDQQRTLIYVDILVLPPGMRLLTEGMAFWCWIRRRPRRTTCYGPSPVSCSTAA